MPKSVAQLRESARDKVAGDRTRLFNFSQSGEGFLNPYLG
jgi:hypothetical protein